ncbi:hypothetical protein K438DRAFT_592154 [Mycena galopus ATCC 62051]|nr:hypothetical protein K438DRAFT_592154 [Mycena galopus ATCC 62051]
MPDVFVPPEVAASFVAYMTAQGGALPPSFTELSSRLSAALATPTPSGVLSLSQPTQRAFSASTSRASRATDTLPRRALAPRRMHSLPPEDADGPEEFLAALQRHTLPALPVLRGATLQSPPSLPPTPPVISTSLPHDLAPSPSSSLASSPNRHGSVFGSSPTLQGNNTPPSRCRFLSPLRLDSETLAGSPSESTLRKRKAYLITEERDGELNDGEERDDEEEDEAEWRRLEEAAQRARESWTGLKIRIPARGAAAGGGEGGGHGGGAGGGNSINLWTPDCPRRGDAERMGSAAAIGHMPCDQSGCGDCEGGGGEDEENNDDRAGQGSGRGLQGRGRNNAQGGKRKRAKKIKATWRLDEDGGPPITEGAGLLLSKLLAVFGRAHRQDLEEVLEGMIDGSLSTTSHDMASVVASIKRQTNEIRVRELHLMLSLIQLALNVDSLRADNKLKCLPRRRVTDKALAEQYAPGTHENTFRDWVHHGKKLALLCAGGTLYLLPIIAALNLRTYITRQVPGEDILSLASALRRVKHGLWRPMVHQLMIPIFHMRGCSSGYVEGLRLHWNMPQPVGNHSPDVQTFAFRDIELSHSAQTVPRVGFCHGPRLESPSRPI